MVDVTGAVVDTAHREVRGAIVEVTAGSSAGITTTTNERGRFSLPEKIAVPFTLRITGDGFLPATKVLDREVRGTGVDFWIELTANGPMVNMTGTYTVTLTAADACTNLPFQARARTYTMTIQSLPKPTDFRVALSDARFFAYFAEFGLQTAGNFVRFDVYRWIDEIEPAIVEQLQDDAFLAFNGIASMTAEPSGITNTSTAFEGVFEYCPERPSSSPYRCASAARVTCTSANHRFTLVRR
jgi:hypothetical protein